MALIQISILNGTPRFFHVYQVDQYIFYVVIGCT